MGNESSTSFDIFETGELEEEMKKQTQNSDSFRAYYEIFTSAYDEVIQAVIRPPRKTYSLSSLGEATMEIDGKSIIREDIELINQRNLRLQCSFWQNSELLSSALKVPCIVYAHGNSSCRLEVLYLLEPILSKGYSVMTFDFSGAGLSEGEYVTLGYYEKDDLHTVMEYLYVSGKASMVGIWSRCIGAASVLLYLNEVDSTEFYSFPAIKTIEFSCNDASGDIVVTKVDDIQSQAIVGDSIIAVDNILTRGLSQVKVKQLVQNTSSSSVIHLRTRNISLRSNTPFVIGVCIDSAYSDIDDIVKDMVQTVTKSASKRHIVFPSLVISTALRMVAKSVQNRANFDMKRLKPISLVHMLRTPALFVACNMNDFIRPVYSKSLYAKYGGAKEFVEFDGFHEANRPQCIIDATCSFFEQCFAQAVEKGKKHASETREPNVEPVVPPPPPPLTKRRSFGRQSRSSSNVARSPSTSETISLVSADVLPYKKVIGRKCVFPVSITCIVRASGDENSKTTTTYPLARTFREYQKYYRSLINYIEASLPLLETPRLMAQPQQTSYSWRSSKAAKYENQHRSIEELVVFTFSHAELLEWVETKAFFDGRYR